MIKLIKLQCPNCGASLDVDSSLKTCFCQYCGTKILIHNENEKIIRKVDEAKIRQAELEHDLEVRRMDKAQEDAEIQRDIAMAQAQGEQNVRERVVLDLGNIQEQDCSYIVSSLEMSGFTHISAKNLHDGKRRLFSGGNLNKVEKITLNGKPPKRGTLYPQDVPVIITYHGE